MFVGAVAIMSALVTQPVAAAGTLHVTPDSGLRGGEVVSVSGTGFTPRDQLFLVECLASAGSQSGCATATATLVKASSTGSFTAKRFRTHVGQIGNGKCGTTTANANGGDTASASISFKVRSQHHSS
jgi:Neocarzinostatin family